MAMTQNGRIFLFAALSCGLIAGSLARLRASRRTPPVQSERRHTTAKELQAAAMQPQARQRPASSRSSEPQPAAAGGLRIRNRTGPAEAPALRQGAVCGAEGAAAGVEGRLQDLAEPGRGLHHHRRRAQGLQEPEQRRRARRVHRSVLAAPQSQPGFAGERVPRRALPAHRLCQRALCSRQAGWKTDRGHIYIAFGQPDDIDSHPSGGLYERPPEEGGGAPALSRSRFGTTGISKASAKTSTSSLWIPASAATITSPSTAARRMHCCTFPAPA